MKMKRYLSACCCLCPLLHVYKLFVWVFQRMSCYDKVCKLFVWVFQRMSCYDKVIGTMSWVCEFVSLRVWCKFESLNRSRNFASLQVFSVKTTKSRKLAPRKASKISLRMNSQNSHQTQLIVPINLLPRRTKRKLLRSFCAVHVWGLPWARHPKQYLSKTFETFKTFKTFKWTF